MTKRTRLRSPNGDKVLSFPNGHHLARALRLQGWTDADTAEQKDRKQQVDERSRKS